MHGCSPLTEGMDARLSGRVEIGFESRKLRQHSKSLTYQFKAHIIVDSVGSQIIHEEAVLKHDLIKNIICRQPQICLEDRNRDSNLTLWRTRDDRPFTRITPRVQA